MTRLATIPLLLLAMTAPLTAQTATPAEAAAARRSIQSGNAAYIEAFKRADANALAQVYDPEGARLNEGGTVVRGRRAITDDVGRFVGKVGPSRARIGGHYVTVWKR